jgi:hypothetical protein
MTTNTNVSNIYLDMLKTTGITIYGIWIGTFALRGFYRGAKCGYYSSLNDTMVVNENCSLLKYAEIGTLIGVIATGQGILEGWIAAYAPITAPVGYIAGKVFNPSLLPLPPPPSDRA